MNGGDKFMVSCYEYIRKQKTDDFYNIKSFFEDKEKKIQKKEMENGIYDEDVRIQKKLF